LFYNDFASEYRFLNPFICFFFVSFVSFVVKKIKVRIAEDKGKRKNGAEQKTY